MHICTLVSSMTKIEFEPIGLVRSPEKVSRKGDFSSVEAKIVLNEDLTEGLKGLGEFSHVEVIFFMHIPDSKTHQEGLSLMVRPMGRDDMPSVGLFATRSPHRPNRLGITLCEIVSIDRNVIKVRGLDALDGSPVLDLKAPSLRNWDKYPDMRFADWALRLKEIRLAEK